MAVHKLIWPHSTRGGGGGLKAIPPLAAILGEVENWKQCVGIGLWRGWGVAGNYFVMTKVD